MFTQLETRLDAPTVGAFQRELELVESRVIPRMYDDFKLYKLFPFQETTQPWVERSTYQTIDGVGHMELRSPRATNMPEVELLGEEFSQRTYDYITGYTLSEQEIAASAHRNVPIEETKIRIVQRVYEEHLNRIVLYGDRRTNNPGIINDPRWLRLFAPFPLSAASTHNQMLATLNAATAAIDVATENNVKLAPDTLLLPKHKYDYLKSQTRLESSDKDNVLSYFVGNNSSITDVDWLTELAGAGPNGEDCAIFYKRDPIAFQVRIFDPFRPRPIFMRNPYEWYRAYSFKYGGIAVFMRTAVLVMIGI